MDMNEKNENTNPASHSRSAQFQARQIQFLVDGELSNKDRHSFLRSLDETSGGWKQLALAFVEQQLMDEAFAPLASEMKEASREPYVPKAPSVPWNQQVHSFRFWASFITAALVGFLCGVFGMSTSPNTFTKSQPNITANDLTAGSMDSKDSRKSDQEETRTSGAASPINQPISLAEAISRSIHPIPTPFRHEMLKAGYRVFEDQKQATVKLPTGGSIELPIRDVQIKYVGISAFQ